MEVTFKTLSLQKLCENEKKLKQKYKDKAFYIQKTLSEIKAFENLYPIKLNPMYGLHTLSGKRSGTMAIYTKSGDKTYGLRFVIKNINGEDVCNDFENLELFKSITEIEIIDLIDYH
ncbi:MAG: hypothetical protein PHI37_05005 [Candidatus Gracilibacteria bacterium]|nr:hypothetical protein [Candidatus Gracilibacteria bacterium]